MKEYCFTVECGFQKITVVYVTLVGLQCPEGTTFIQAVGMWDNFSVARGKTPKRGLQSHEWDSWMLPKVYLSRLGPTEISLTMTINADSVLRVEEDTQGADLV